MASLSSNENFIRVCANVIPELDTDKLRRRLAPRDLNARYIAACMTLEDARCFGTRAAIEDATIALAEVTRERRNILRI